MNRIIDFNLSDEETVVARILVQVHKAVDQHFPSAEAASRQFTKTVFSEEDAESTAMLKATEEDLPPQFADQVSTSQIEVASPHSDSPRSAKEPTAEKANFDGDENTATDLKDLAHQADWVSKIILVVLLAGLVMLAYLLLVPA